MRILSFGWKNNILIQKRVHICCRNHRPLPTVLTVHIVQDLFKTSYNVICLPHYKKDRVRNFGRVCTKIKL